MPRLNNCDGSGDGSGSGDGYGSGSGSGSPHQELEGAAFTIGNLATREGMTMATIGDLVMLALNRSES
jgi:hypothetical protein